ncbi:MAG: SPASM domain-containing protein [Methylovirgula sp.]|nr:SPASM domain-containing protein [Methylovirgula sp.]
MTDVFAGKFCSNPWTYCEIYAGGGVYICCPAWNYNKHVGNIFYESFDEIWNSAQAQLFRAGILDGSFSACDHQKCPFIVSRSLPTIEQERHSWLAPIINDVLEHQRIVATKGPSVVKIGYDASCNLTCPSCRDDMILAKKAEQEKLNNIRDNFILPLLKDARVLVMSSDGDPFASNHYRDIMRITDETLPDLKLGICTNAVLLDERAWQDCHLEGRVTRVQVSIDAAKEETYKWVRRGGDFERLKRNLRFISEKRQTSNGFSGFDILFVVQACNYREMPDFVRLGQELNVDSVQFMLIDHWGRGMNASQYQRAKIWDRRHPEFGEFMDILRNDIFRSPIVQLGGVDALLREEFPPEIHVANGSIERVLD